MTKVSVIVPIYNVEKYLRRSIESIQTQTLKDIQIILVNDGSTDNSLSICKEYQEKDNRIELIDKPNGGVSSARNAGLEVAKGEYIGFVDPDDWIDHNMYENLYQQIIEDDADVCMCNYIVENNGKSLSNLLDLKQKILEGQDIVDQIITNMIGSSNLNSGSKTIMGSACRLLIKRDFIDQYHFRFKAGISLMEDLIFCVQVLLKSKRVSFNRGVYYHYIININSAVTSYNYNVINIEKKVYQALDEIFKKERVYPFVEQRLKIRYVNMYTNAIANEVHRENYKNIKEKIIYIKRLCKDNKLKSILKEIDTNGYTLRKKIVLAALKNEIAIYLYFYYSLLIRVVSK
ncbi:glycosyltransferase [Psychrobacillus sp. L3]|uniref:glycosyltransferase n=1 Tax=Psychrobacillus sp. L3 TaxID=3236891 RepID=UPI0036F2F21E